MGFLFVERSWDNMSLTFKKVYTVSKKGRNRPRIWLYETVSEAAGFQIGQPLYISLDVEQQQIIVQNAPISDDDHVVHVTGKKNETSGKLRPIVDTAKDSYRSIIDVSQKAEICVYREGEISKVIIRPLRYNSFDKEVLVKPDDERITTFTICSGMGVVTAAFQETGYFTSVGAIELEEDSSSVYRHNFKSSFVFNGDLRDCSTVAKADVAIVTLPCDKHSLIGDGEGAVFRNLAFATSELIRATECRAVFFENVPQFYESEEYQDIKNLLMNDYPFWQEQRIEAADFGSLARRKRVYALAVKSEEDFLHFQFPSPPKRTIRKKVREYLDRKGTPHEWKPLEKWMQSFTSKAEKGNSWSDRGLAKTFVDEMATEIQCIPKRYTAQSASSSYLLSEDRNYFRFFSINEILRILSVPAWFEIPDYIGKIRQYEMLGQSVDCRVIASIANRLAAMFYKVRRNKIENSSYKEKDNQKMRYSIPISLNQHGQLELVF